MTKRTGWFSTRPQFKNETIMTYKERCKKLLTKIEKRNSKAKRVSGLIKHKDQIISIKLIIAKLEAEISEYREMLSKLSYFEMKDGISVYNHGTTLQVYVNNVQIVNIDIHKPHPAQYLRSLNRSKYFTIIEQQLSPYGLTLVDIGLK